MLSEKLRNLNQQNKEAQEDKKHQTMAKIHNLQEKVGQKATANDIQFKILHEQIDRLLDELDDERRVREDFEVDMETNIYPDPDSGKYLSLSQISDMVATREEEARKEMDNNLTSLVDEKIFNLTLALAKEK